MSKIIDCLKLMNQTTNQFDLAKKLNISWLQMLELIGKINSIEPELVDNRSGNSLLLTRKLNWIDSEKVTKNLIKLQLSGYIVKILPEIESTNSYVLNHINNLQDKTIVAAEYQSQGRGRSNKVWVSKIATDITVSILYFFDLEFSYELLPLITAISINRLLKQYRQQNFIKWPNDIYLSDNTKVSGILLDSGIRGGKRFVVVGIGLDNVYGLDRSELLSNLVNHMDHVLKEYSAFGFAMFRQEWLDNCMHFNKKVTLYKDGQIIDSGINVDLTLDGQLVVESNGNKNQYISSSVGLRIDGMK